MFRSISCNSSCSSSSNSSSSSRSSSSSSSSRRRRRRRRSSSSSSRLYNCTRVLDAEYTTIRVYWMQNTQLHSCTECRLFKQAVCAMYVICQLTSEDIKHHFSRNGQFTQINVRRLFKQAVCAMASSLKSTYADYLSRLYVQWPVHSNQRTQTI